jgi:hypothetical protein
MSLAATKLIISKTWVFIKNYWHIPFVITVILISWLVFRTNNDRMVEVLKNSIQSYEKEIDILKNSHKKEIEVRDELLEQYNDVIGELEKQFENKKEVLDENKRKEVKELVEKYKNDNEALAKELSEKFGVDYVSN